MSNELLCLFINISNYAGLINKSEENDNKVDKEVEDLKTWLKAIKDAVYRKVNDFFSEFASEETLASQVDSQL